MKMQAKIIETVTNSSQKETVIPLSERIAVEYLDALFKNDIQAIMSNYTSKSIVITLEKTYKGLNEIEEFMDKLISFFLKKNTVLILDKIAMENEIVYIVWHTFSTKSNISMATDSFYIENEKISRHTFIYQLDNGFKTINHH